MIKIRYQTPTGAVAETDIPDPGKPMSDWQLRGYIRRELQRLNIQFKNKPKII